MHGHKKEKLRRRYKRGILDENIESQFLFPSLFLFDMHGVSIHQDKQRIFYGILYILVVRFCHSQNIQHIIAFCREPPTPTVQAAPLLETNGQSPGLRGIAVVGMACKVPGPTGNCETLAHGVFCDTALVATELYGVWSDRPRRPRLRVERK